MASVRCTRYCRGGAARTCSSAAAPSLSTTVRSASSGPSKRSGSVCNLWRWSRGWSFLVGQGRRRTPVRRRAAKTYHLHALADISNPPVIATLATLSRLPMPPRSTPVYSLPPPPCRAPAHLVLTTSSGTSSVCAVAEQRAPEPKIRAKSDARSGRSRCNGPVARVPKPRPRSLTGSR